MRRLLIHGSATDGSTWGPLIRAMAGAEVAAPDRDPALTSVADHAAALEPLIDGPTLAIGSSFGGIIALELARRDPGRIAGVVAMEPPAPASVLSPAVPHRLGCLFDLAAAVGDGEAAAEVFVRAVLGDAAFERIPARLRERTLSSWPAIRADMRCLAGYRFERLAAVAAPVLVLRGDRSPARFDASIATLERLLADVRVATIAGAGHMMHVEAAAAVAGEVERCAASLSR